MKKKEDSPGSSVHGIFQARVLEWGAIVLIGVLHSIDFSSLFLYGLRKLQKCVLQTSEISTRFPVSNIYLCDVWIALISGVREGNGNPLHSCLENLMDRGASWATVHGVTESWTKLSDFTFTFHFHALEKEMATHSSVLAWRIPGVGEPGGLLSMGLHRVRHNWSDLAAAADQCSQWLQPQN